MPAAQGICNVRGKKHPRQGEDHHRGENMEWASSPLSTVTATKHPFTRENKPGRASPAPQIRA